MWRLRGFRNWELLFQQHAYGDFQRTLRGTVPPKDATQTALKRELSQNLMSTIHYFAYGSNMSTPRLRYRVPGCRFTFVARLPNYKLCFHKRSKDGSAKCNAFRTAEPTDAVIGAVYQIPPYSWYKDFVLAGAAEHQLPPEYVESRIRAVHAIGDPDPQREQVRRAEIKP
jgi:hypothetical protein